MANRGTAIASADGRYLIVVPPLPRLEGALDPAISASAVRLRLGNHRNGYVVAKPMGR